MQIRLVNWYAMGVGRGGEGKLPIHGSNRQNPTPVGNMKGKGKRKEGGKESRKEERLRSEIKERRKKERRVEKREKEKK